MAIEFSIHLYTFYLHGLSYCIVIPSTEGRANRQGPTVLANRPKLNNEAWVQAQFRAALCHVTPPFIRRVDLVVIIHLPVSHSRTTSLYHQVPQ